MNFFSLFPLVNKCYQCLCYWYIIHHFQVYNLMAATIFTNHHQNTTTTRIYNILLILGRCTLSNHLLVPFPQAISWQSLMFYWSSWMCLFWTLHISYNTKLFVCSFFQFGIILSKFIHIVSPLSTSFIFISCHQ
jgi:hypothetical protein